MLVKSSRNDIYERILTAKNGQLVRVQFAVVEVDGVMRGRVISVTPIVSVASKSVQETQLCLSGRIASDIADAVESLFTRPQHSPYFSFEFFMSQPTRAPSL